MLFEFLSQTVPTIQPSEISTQSILAIATVAGAVFGAIYGLIQLGDRLWGKSKEVQVEPKNGNGKVADAVSKLGEDCVKNREKLTDSMTNLSEAMIKYIELQQASLQISEYRHDDIRNKIIALTDTVSKIDDNRITDMRALHERLDKIMQSFIEQRKRN